MNIIGNAWGFLQSKFLKLTGGSLTGKLSIVVPDAANVDSLYIEQNDTTNNPKAVYIKNTSTGEAFRFEQNGALGNSKTCFAIYSNQVNVGSDSYLLKMENDNSSSSIPLAYLKQDGTGINLILDNTNTGGDSHGIQIRFPSGAGAKFLEFLTNWSAMFTVNNNGDVVSAGDIKAATYHVGATAGIDATVTYVDTLLGAKTLTFTKGILTAQT